ncbi:MAG: ketol-acid reductoisomerase [Bacteroidota bacterium]
MSNYFNSLSETDKTKQLGKCDFLESSEFGNGLDVLKEKKIVIVGCGAQGLNQGLNMRDSGLNVSFALRKSAIESRRPSFRQATEHNFSVGTYQEMIPSADLVINLTPDKQHTAVVKAVEPFMKQGATLSYSHGFNIVEEGMKIRSDITVIMMAPKSPGTELREEFKRGFGVPTLIAVHPENDPSGDGLEIAKAYAVATGGHKAGVLNSSFVAEVKSDLMGEQTILCGLLQTGSILLFDKMVAEGIDPGYAALLIQYGWETQSEAMKHGGISQMLDQLTDPAKVKAHQLSIELKHLMKPLFNRHMQDILSGVFSERMIKDWKQQDADLLKWREETGQTSFERTSAGRRSSIHEQEYFDHAVLMVALIKAGVELAFETMTRNGIKAESAYYESLHEVPLIANLIARKKLYEMNTIISDTAEYGCYLFDHACRPLLRSYIQELDSTLIGRAFKTDRAIDSESIRQTEEAVHNHPVEKIGRKLRQAMTSMKTLAVEVK